MFEQMQQLMNNVWQMFLLVLHTIHIGQNNLTGYYVWKTRGKLIFAVSSLKLIYVFEHHTFKNKITTLRCMCMQNEPVCEIKASVFTDR
jgi:hypothetical protein